MVSAILQFLICGVLIVVAGSLLTQFADAIGEITHLGRLLIGSVLLAAVTSLPEPSVDVSAVQTGMADLAVGDLLGSSLMNLLILAVLDLSVHSHGKMLSKQSAAHALSGSLSAALMALVGLGLYAGPKLVAFAPLGISPPLVLVAVTYVFGVRLVYLDQRIAVREATRNAELPIDRRTLPPMPLRHALAGFSCCAIVIAITGPYLAEAAGRLAYAIRLGKYVHRHDAGGHQHVITGTGFDAGCLAFGCHRPGHR